MVHALEMRAVETHVSVAEGWVREGRHARGHARLRVLIGVCRRRGQAGAAARVALVLAGSLQRRGYVAGAQAVLADVRDAVLSDDTLAIDAAVLEGDLEVDRLRLGDAAATLGRAVEQARRLGDAWRVHAASAALARCRFWQGQYAEAFELASPESLSGVDVSGVPDIPVVVCLDRMRVRLLGLQARAAVGRGDVSAAVRLAEHALQLSMAHEDDAAVHDAAYAGSWAALCDGDYRCVARLTHLAAAAAKRMHNPLGSLRARLLGAEAERRVMRVALAQRVVRRVSAARRAGNVRPLGSLPALLGVRCQLLADLLGGGDAEHIVERHVRASGLPALSLLVPRAADPGVGPRGIDDIGSLVWAAQQSPDPREALRQLCTTLRVQLGASYVGVHRIEPPFDGLFVERGRLDHKVAARILETDCSQIPRPSADTAEGVMPARADGRTVGLLVSRFDPRKPLSVDRWVALSTAAAALAGPLMHAWLIGDATDGRGQRSEDGQLSGGGERDTMIGASPVFAETRRAIAGAALVAFPVVIEGESGSGKELVAREIHARSDRRQAPLRTLNCAALPDELVESELFGVARGAYTGAVIDRPGLFEDANGGTLFLDEVGELSLRAQAKLLRTIQEGEIRRVGETRPRRVDVRLIAATNRDLRDEVAAGRFRLDLWYRLAVLHVAVPPLRARRTDIAGLAHHLWLRVAGQARSCAVLSRALLEVLEQYDWPGNVRELENVLAALAVHAPKRGLLQPVWLPSALSRRSAPESGACGSAGQPPHRATLEEARRSFDASFVADVLARHHGCRARAARELGVTRQGLAKLVRRLRVLSVSETRSGASSVAWGQGEAESAS